MTAGLALLGLTATLCFARSVRVGFSGPIGTYLSLLQIPSVIAAVWALSTVVGWWAIAAFVAASLLAGVVVSRRTVGWWVAAQPVVGVTGAAASIAALVISW